MRMPAEGAYLSVLRTATAGLAARLDFTLDEIEDLRIAVDEACAMLLSQAVPGSSLECSVHARPRRDDHLGVGAVPDATARRPATRSPGPCSTALAGSVDAQVGPGDVLTIVLRKTRAVVGVGVTGEIEVTLTEEFETTMAAEAGATAADEADGQAAVIEFAEAGEARRARPGRRRRRERGEVSIASRRADPARPPASGGGPGSCSSGSSALPEGDRGAACASAASWSSCTCRWSSTWRGGSGTAASGSTT